MGTCKYCGKDAGWFSSCHSQCEAKYHQGLASVKQILSNCFAQRKDFYLQSKEIDTLSQDAYIFGDRKEALYVDVLDNAVDGYLNDGMIDDAEKKTIARFIQFSQLPQAVLNRNHAIEKMLQSEVLQDIVNGRTPKPRITISGNFPFLLGKGETLIWLFRDIVLYEQKVKREYQGRSSGMSFRVCKGVYYRVGGFKGHPIETTYMQKIGIGSVCLTDKHVYFSCPEKSLKLPYDKLISVESYSNGIGLQKEGATAKPLFLEGINSWFCYNVIANLKP